MSDLRAILDRVEIEALRGEFTDAVMMNDHDRLASLFMSDGAIPASAPPLAPYDPPHHDQPRRAP